MPNKSYKRKFFFLMIMSILLRVLVSMNIELGNDEVYYRLYADPMQWNYFDHPPIIGWLIRFTTFNLFFDNDFFIRLGSIICGSLTLLMIFKCGVAIKDERTGFFAAAIYSATLYGTIISSVFILPDSPQMFFWSISIFLLIKIADRYTSRSKLDIYLISFGISTGLGMLCKVHTVFLWLGFLIFIIIKRRDLLVNLNLYLSALVTFIFFIPVIKWNFDHHFITYSYHSNRVNHLEGGINLSSFLIFNVGQIFYTSIILFPIFIKAIFHSLKKTKEIEYEVIFLLICVSLPLIIVSNFLSLFNTVLPHWSGPSFAGISIMSGIYLSEKTIQLMNVPKILKYALGFSLIVCITGIIMINHFPGTLGNKDENRIGNGDFTLDMYGWKNIKNQIYTVLQNDLNNKIMSSDDPFLENKWFPAAHIEHYIANPLNRTVLVFGPISDIHQYLFLNESRKKLKKGDGAYCIVPSNYAFDAIGNFGNLFSSYDTAAIIPSNRSNKVVRKFFLLRFKGYK